MFSGQGSQYFQMGRGLFDKEPIFSVSMLRFEQLMKKYTGKSLLDKIYNSSNRYEDFDEIEYTHPALYAVQISLAEVLKKNGIYPDCVMGYSLGEYVAGAMAGIYSVEEGMKMIVSQSAELSRFANLGGMMVILGDQDEINSEGILNKVSIAAANYNGNFTVSGSLTELTILEENFKRRGIYSEILPVKYPFHSNLIDAFRSRFINGINQIKLNSPKIFYHSCTIGDQLKVMSKEHLWDIIRAPIDFQASIRRLSNEQDLVYIDLSPTGTLAAFVRNCSEGKLKTFSTINKYGNDIRCIHQLLDKIKQC
jgi:acyl transferase domain-containing protein